MTPLRKLSSRGRIASELIAFLWTSKRWWLIPFIITFLVLGALILAGQVTGTSPFLYPLF